MYAKDIKLQMRKTSIDFMMLHPNEATFKKNMGLKSLTPSLTKSHCKDPNTEVKLGIRIFYWFF